MSHIHVYRYVPEGDGDLLLKHAGEFVFINNLKFYTIYVRMLLYTHNGKGKGKAYPTTVHEGPEGEWRYSSTLSLTSALEKGGQSTPRPGRFTPGKDPGTLCKGG